MVALQEISAFCEKYVLILQTTLKTEHIQPVFRMHIKVDNFMQRLKHRSQYRQLIKKHCATGFLQMFVEGKIDKFSLFLSFFVLRVFKTREKGGNGSLMFVRHDVSYIVDCSAVLFEHQRITLYAKHGGSFEKVNLSLFVRDQRRERNPVD